MTDYTVANTLPGTLVACIVCFTDQPLHQVTAGSLYADGQQAFACTTHLNDRYEWITAWAIFDRAQQQPQFVYDLEMVCV